MGVQPDSNKVYLIKCPGNECITQFIYLFLKKAYCGNVLGLLFSFNNVWVFSWMCGLPCSPSFFFSFFLFFKHKLINCCLFNHVCVTTTSHEVLMFLPEQIKKNTVLCHVSLNQAQSFLFIKYSIKTGKCVLFQCSENISQEEAVMLYSCVNICLTANYRS